MEIYMGDYYISDGTKPIDDIKIKYPIEWIPLAIVDNKVLMISKYVIDWELYDDEPGKSWNDTYMCTYLAKLYNDLFSDEEKQVIVKDEKLGHLFLLSKEEIEKYMPSVESRRSVMFLAKRKDSEVEVTLEHYTYWARDEEFLNEVPYIDALGEFTYGTSYADEIGIRPAMWVTNKARILSGKKGYNIWHHYDWEPEDY